jgi:hypothetical protein
MEDVANERRVILEPLRECLRIIDDERIDECEQFNLVRSKLSFLVDWLDIRTRQDNLAEKLRREEIRRNRAAAIAAWGQSETSR